MPKTVKFEGATHQFPDDATDEEIRSALQSAHPAPTTAPSYEIKPQQTYMEKANTWLKTNHPSVYSALESALTLPDRGIDQVTRAAAPGRKTSQRISDAIEGTGTLAEPLLLAVPGSGQIGKLAAGAATGAASKLGVEALLKDVVEPDTARAAGDVAGVVGGVAGPEGMAALAGKGTRAYQIARHPLREIAKLLADAVEEHLTGKSAAPAEPAASLPGKSPDIPGSGPKSAAPGVSIPVEGPESVIAEPASVKPASVVKGESETLHNSNTSNQIQPPAPITIKELANAPAKEVKAFLDSPARTKPWVMTPEDPIFKQLTPERQAQYQAYWDAGSPGGEGPWRMQAVKQLQERGAGSKVEKPATIDPKPSTRQPPRGKGMSQVNKDAGKLVDQAAKWEFSPAEIRGMDEKSWAKLAFDAGVPARTGAELGNMKQRVWMGLANKLAGPAKSGTQLMDELKASMPTKE